MDKINGTVFITYDMSNSVNKDSKEIYKNIYDYYNNRYREVVVIRHNTQARITTIEDIMEFNISCGSYFSSGIRLLFGDLISRDNKNDIVVICGDGDNWSEDNERFINIIKAIPNKIKLYQIFAPTYTTSVFAKIKDINNVERFIISDKNNYMIENEIHKKEKTTNKMKQLESASKPLVDFMNQHCCPNDIIIIQQGQVQLLNGEIGIPTEILD